MSQRAIPAPFAPVLNWLIAAGALTQAISAPILWGHRSADGVIFDAYTLRYALLLAGHVALCIGWAALLLRRPALLRALAAVPAPLRICAALVGAGFGALVALLPVEAHVQSYLAANALLFSLVLLALSPSERDASRSFARWIGWAGGALAGIVVIGVALSAFTRFPFSPDEAHWADYASTAWMGSTPGIYARTWLMEPQRITPGIGWSVAAYGWLLENAAFDIRVGRLWNLAFSGLAIIGAGVLTARLYGRRAGWMALCFAALSQGILPVYDYRPDHQLAFAGVLLALTAAAARSTRRGAPGLHALTGLLAAFSLQLHAAGIAFAFGISLFYVSEQVGRALRRTRVEWGALLAYGGGALLGTGIYFALNIAPAGGLEAYLGLLTAERSVRLTWFAFLTWYTLAEWMLIALALLFLAARRSQPDQFLLGIILCIWIGLVLFDTQGYRAPVAALYAVGAGAALAAGFGVIGGRAWVAVVVFVIMGGGAAASVDLNGLRTWAQSGSPPPYLYAALRAPLNEWVSDDDVIAGSHLLIWSLPDHPHLISYAAELTAMRRWSLSDPAQVWERAAPTVIVEIAPEMTINPGLAAYMERHQFAPCTRFSVQHVMLTLYRTGCTSDE